MTDYQRLVRAESEIEELKIEVARLTDTIRAMRYEKLSGQEEIDYNVGMTE